MKLTDKIKEELAKKPCASKAEVACAATQLDKLQKEFGESGALDYLGYCYDRWQDEKDYEDWADYEKMLKKRFESVKPTKVTKKPFAVHFLLNGIEACFKVQNVGKEIVGTLSYVAAKEES